MRFAIRDDDTNYFTKPEALEDSYKGIWGVVSPSLCVISKVKGNWPLWVREIYEKKERTNWREWRNDDTVYPIEHNQSLIDFLKAELKCGNIDVCFHAKHHRNEDYPPPRGVRGNYIQGAEFFTDRDLTEYIRTEVTFLSSLFNYPITVFTPPQNLLSARGYECVLKAGLNICASGISFHKKSKDITGIMNMAKQLMFRIRWNDDYPHVVNFTKHAEINYNYPLQPNTRLADMIEKFESVRKHDGDFVLSTHHAEFGYRMEYNAKYLMRDVLDEFLDHISKYSIEYTTLSKMLTRKKKPASKINPYTKPPKL